MDKLLQENLKESESQASEEINDAQERANVMSLIRNKLHPPPDAAALSVKKVTLQGILKKVSSKKSS